MIFLKYSYELLGKRIPKGLVLAFLALIFVSLGVGVVRQVSVNKRINQKLSQKLSELVEVEKRNQELKAKLEDVKSPVSLENQTRRMLGLPLKETLPLEEIGDLRVKNEPVVPKYRQWLSFFLY